MLLVEKNHASEDMIFPILKSIKELDRCYFFDRGKLLVNKGIKGDSGSYFSMSEDTCPLDILRQLRQLALKVDPYEVDQIVINYYPVGSFIPPHTDLEGYFAFGVLVLEDSDSKFVYYEDRDLNGRKEIIDEAGNFIFTDDIGLVHEVPKVTKERYSIIFLYM